MQTQIKVETRVKEDVQVVGMEDKIITEAQVPIPPVDTSALNAREAGGPSTLGLVNNLHNPSFFKISNLFCLSYSSFNAFLIAITTETDFRSLNFYGETPTS